MKANEAPEKLYYAPYGNIIENHPITDNDIEYTRTDDFIEKAVKYLDNNYRRMILTARAIEDFKNYMKGE